MTSTQNYRRVLATNATTSAFAAKAPTTTEPSGTGVIPLVKGQDTLDLQFFGAGSDNNTFDFRIIGWRRVLSEGASGTPELWVPTILFQGTATLSAVVGVAGAILVATDRFADTITKTYGGGDFVYTVASDAGPATLTLDVTGQDKFELALDMTGATNGNAIYAAYAEGGR